MKQRRIVWVLVAVLAVSAVGQPITVSGVQGKSIKDLEGSPTLVTIVLKASGAKDANLRIIEVHQNDLVVLTQNNERYSYLFEDIQEVRVQGGKVEPRRPVLPKMTTLRAEDQKVVDRAQTRTREIFSASNDNQDRKILAAVLLALEEEKDALDYLRSLAESNDMKTQLQATQALYLVGERVSETVLRAGLESGNRAARARAATLAGLTGYHESGDLLHSMLKDRSAELSSPAARALARLGIRDIIPRLMQLLADSNEDKASAANAALKILGGDDVVALLKERLQVAQAQERFRIAATLHEMGYDEGKNVLVSTFRDVPTLTPEAALILARDKDWDATQFLRARLARRENPTPENLLYRARNAASLFVGGDPSALAVFQELLRADNTEVKHLVCSLATEINDRRLLPIIQPVLENVDADIAMSACITAVTIAMPEFRERFLQVHERP